MDQDELIREFKEMMDASLFDMDTHDFYLKAIRILMNSPPYKGMIASLDKPEAPTPRKCTCDTDSEMFSCIAHCDHDIESVGKEGGWIKWEGGERPIPDFVECEVRLRNGDVQHECNRWNHYNEGEAYYRADVVAYRVIVEEKKPEKQTLEEFTQERHNNYFELAAFEVLQEVSAYFEFLEREDS